MTLFIVEAGLFFIYKMNEAKRQNIIPAVKLVI